VVAGQLSKCKQLSEAKNLSDLSPQELAARIKAEAAHLGFSLVGIAPAARPDTLDFLHDWLNRGMHGEMGYMSRRKDAYAHPSGVMPEVRSLILLSMNYSNEQSSDSATGRIAKYATGETDYHDLMRSRLKSLVRMLREAFPESRNRVIVDTAPLLERDFARKAGLGWFGKNTLLINKYEGSYFFLAGILTDLELPADSPHETSHCGTCTRCLDACPTDAFDGPYTLDARKCISYLTIELRDQEIPDELRSGIGDWLFGCDICQDVCPWNRKSPGTSETEFSPQSREPTQAVEFLNMSEEEFRQRFKGTPLERTGRVALARNAAIVLGNSGDSQWESDLKKALNEGEPLVQEASRWALDQISDAQIKES